MARRGAQARTETLEVEVQADHLEGLAKCRPSSAVAELIWNALDADAEHVSVIFQRNSLGGLESIEVSDDGHGVGGEGEDPNELFRRLGGSWKRRERRTRTGRAVHGQAGEGRFKAFALGDSVTWTTQRVQNGELTAFKIAKSRNSRQFTRSTLTSHTKSHTGTIVRIDHVHTTPAPDSEVVFRALCQEFALYLKRYPSIVIEFDHQRIDPQSLIARVDQVMLDVDVGDDENAVGELTIVEWAMPVDRALYLCDEDGFALAQVPAGIQAPGFSFTAHAKARFLRRLKEQDLIDSDLAPGRERMIGAAKRVLREHFRKRAAELAHGAVERWRTEDVYPYADAPAATPVESMERQVFDICALNLSGYLPDFESSDPKQKRLTFRLLRQALEQNPDSLQTILGEVLGLPKEQQDDLADLLGQTSLSAIINASKVVADRLSFLKGLEGLIFDELSRDRLRERKELHRLLALNTWIFGEEFNLTIDDESLESVLRKHRALLGSEQDDDEPVLREDGSQGVIDLMLSRSVPQPDPLQREHLVIELKRPKQKVDDKVLSQTKSYAFAVAADERFRDTGTKWRFVAVSNQLSDSVRRQATQKNRPPGLVHDDQSEPVTVWVFTWSQLLQQARARLEFFRKELNYNATQDIANAHLQRVYAKYLPPDEANGPEGSSPPLPDPSPSPDAA